jgi:SAM-dependent methyltransferase
MAFSPFEIWEEFGITEHLGGIRATRRLLEMSRISPGKLVLDIGCGTGYTACLAAHQYQAKLVGVDISTRSIAEARDRVIREDLEDRVYIFQADALRLPFEQETFDHVLVESVLVFGKAAVLTKEMFRVLIAEGEFSANEITLLSPQTGQLNELLEDKMGIDTYNEQGWHQVFLNGGFTDISSKVYQIKFSDQLISHLKIDGLINYLSAVLHGIMDAKLRRVFFTREMFNMGRKFMDLIGYGLYWGRKRIQ